MSLQKHIHGTANRTQSRIVQIGSVAQSTLHQRRTKSNENLLNRQSYDGRNAIPVARMQHASNAYALHNGRYKSAVTVASATPLQCHEMQNARNADYDNVVASDDNNADHSRRSYAGVGAAAIAHTAVNHTAHRITCSTSSGIAADSIPCKQSSIGGSRSTAGEKKKMEFNDQGKFNMFNLGSVKWIF